MSLRINFIKGADWMYFYLSGTFPARFPQLQCKYDNIVTIVNLLEKIGVITVGTEMYHGVRYFIFMVIFGHIPQNGHRTNSLYN